MTKNNYPKGLDELVEKVSDPFVKDMEQYSYYGSNYGIPQDDVADYTRALDERGYVLVDAKKQEPFGYAYEINGNYACFSKERPPVDAYDAGTLVTLYTHPAIPGRVALPDGWKMVPVEPTPEMIHEGQMSRLCPVSGSESSRDIYVSMLSAAPTPQSQPQGDGSLRRDAE